MVKKPKQKLGKRNTYTPLDTSQVHRSVVNDLNREDTLSDISLKTLPNILDVNQQSGTTEQDLRVPVLNMRGQPLMPTTPRKARILLKREKAIVKKRVPFVIQLLYPSGESKQDLVLGIDSGSKIVGCSIISTKTEYVNGEFHLRTDIKKKLDERRMYRRNKRNKLWYRQPRFMNRTKSKKKGWLAPSIKHKLDSHLRFIEKLKQWYPISKVVIEIAKFDAQKLQNVDIEGVEYQQGNLLGYDNLRAFIFCRDNYVCQICKKKEGILEAHHIIQRKDNGSDRPDNLVTVHKSCHKKFHAGKIKHTFTKPKSFRDTSVMNNIKTYVADNICCETTFGYITKRNRLALGIDKSHINDAFIIAGGNNQSRCKPYQISQTRRNNRSTQTNRKGFKPSIRKKRYKYQPNDLVRFNNKPHTVKGVFNYGEWIRLVDDSKNVINTNIKNVEVIRYGKGMQFSIA